MLGVKGQNDGCALVKGASAVVCAVCSDATEEDGGVEARAGAVVVTGVIVRNGPKQAARRRAVDGVRVTRTGRSVVEAMSWLGGVGVVGVSVEVGPGLLSTSPHSNRDGGGTWAQYQPLSN
jgi:hypothetical protein